MLRPRSFFIVTMLISIVVAAGCGTQNPLPQNLSPAVVIKQHGMDVLHEELTAKITAARPETMAGPGLVGAMGGVELKLLKTGTHEVLLPLPQLVDHQVPLCFYIRSTPPKAALEYRLQRRADLNDVVSVKLEGERDDVVQLEWSSVVLIAGKPVEAGDPLPGSYRSATACVQADSTRVRELAGELWPENGEVQDYARNIQRSVREMKRVKQPRSLDAIGILDSGMSGICTGNANLASALMRAKEIPSRSMAVIPTTAQRLEMHRIVEYNGDTQRHYFDPSSLHADVPMNPWQTVIMAKTTTEDESLSMQPRMAAMPGCPYGQEIELLSTGITLWGQDFFWTMAKPLTELETDEETVSRATGAWNRYLQEGLLSETQIKAATATNSTELSETMKAK